MYDLNEINEKHGHYSSPYQDSEESYLKHAAIENDSTYQKQEISPTIEANEPTGVLKEDDKNPKQNKQQALTRIKPIYGTTVSGTETILERWLSGNKQAAILFLMICITVNKPENKYNTEQMAKETIEKWIEDNYEN